MKYFGRIAFSSVEETSPGIFVETPVIRRYRGNVTTNAHRYSMGSDPNGKVQSGQILSIVGDEYAFAHPFDIRWAEFGGEKWLVVYTDIRRPRLYLTLGARYNDER